MKTTNCLKSAAIGTLVLAAGINDSHAIMLGTRLPEPASVQLWMVPLDFSPTAPHPGGRSGVNAVFPVPSGTPDLTFSTNLIQYTTENKAYTINGFFVPGSVINPVFSGAISPLVGSAVGPNTPLYSETCNPQGPNQGCWGTFIEISGNLLLNNGDHIKIDHDDGVSLALNGVVTNCFVTNPPDGHYTASDGPQPCTYNGPSGLVPFDLVYTEGYEVNARLSLAVPEPATLALMSIGLAGMAFGKRRKLT